MVANAFVIETQLLEVIPEVPGLVFRGFLGEADYPHILRVISGSKEHDGVERSDTLEDVARNYAHLHNSDPERDMIFAEVNGEVVGYGRCWWEMEGEGRWVGFQLGYLLPAWRGKGIWEFMLRFLENRLREISEERIRKGLLDEAAPRGYDHFVLRSEKDRRALLEREGYEIVRYAFEMVRPDLENIPALPLPEGLEVRPALPEHFRTIYDASNEAFRDHWGFIPDPWEDFERMMEDPEFDPSLWRVAWDGDQVAGMVLSFINHKENAEYHRKRGYTENICVRRPWRKRGLAKALIALSLQALKERGMEHAALGVDAQNISGALQLYESMGYQVVKQSMIYRKAIE